MKIVQQVAADTLSDAQRQACSRQHAETMAAKALARLALGNKGWAQCAFTAEQDRPSVGLTMSRNAISRLARRSGGDIDRFRTSVSHLLNQRKHIEVPFSMLAEEQQQVVFQALLKTPPSHHLHLKGFAPHNAAYVPLIAERGPASMKVSVDLTDQALDDSHLAQLNALFASPQPKLASIDLRWNPFSQAQLDALPPVHGATQLQHEWNDMSAQAASIVRNVLDQGEDKSILDLSSFRDLADEDLQAITAAMEKNIGRHSALYLNHGLGPTNRIAEQGTRAIASMLEHPDCRLAILNLVAGGVNDQGASALARALASGHCPLVKLNLSANEITPAGATALADAINRSHGKLESLNLRDNLLDGPSRAVLRAAADLKGILLDMG
ncbi:hypothetical protein [Pseudomonas typographi]|uniref:hypothetical protein n=1 Tax=Pseudomonas typographi TaxID=2715964 RepID=UPI0016895CF2|nr:hypothetical protein [Pseudomonas typographi]MBD1585950.1 hypothetical protein [Pseudomonas typographi]